MPSAHIPLEHTMTDETPMPFYSTKTQIDLDDGVKVNYGKFGDLLAEVKAVTGGMGD